MKAHCKIIATLEALPKFETILLPLIIDVDEETRDTLRLVVQELGTNIVRHAYDGVMGTIEAYFHRDGSELELEFWDYAPNPYSQPETISLPNPESLPSGGWGLYIIYHGVDEVLYERLVDGNHWTLVKKLS